MRRHLRSRGGARCAPSPGSRGSEGERLRACAGGAVAGWGAARGPRGGGGQGVCPEARRLPAASEHTQRPLAPALRPRGNGRSRTPGHGAGAPVWPGAGLGSTGPPRLPVEVGGRSPSAPPPLPQRRRRPCHLRAARPGVPTAASPGSSPSPSLCSPMFPSTEIFLRRFWKLESREPVGLWQCRLAGVDMAASGGSTQCSRLLQPTLSLPPAGGRDGCLPPPLPGKRRGPYLLLPPLFPPGHLCRDPAAFTAFKTGVQGVKPSRAALFRKLP